MSCRHPLLVPTFQSYFLSCNHPTLSSTLFPHSQYQNISTLPISKYFLTPNSKQFQTPNIKIFSHSQYQNISKLTISKYFHNLNIKLFPHFQYRNIFTLFRNLIHTISNIKISHPMYFHTLQLLIWTILYISWYVDRPEYWPMTSYWPPHNAITDPMTPKFWCQGSFALFWCFCCCLVFPCYVCRSMLYLVLFHILFGGSMFWCAGWPTSFIPGKWTVKIPIGGQIQILTTEHAQHTKFHKRNV